MIRVIRSYRAGNSGRFGFFCRQYGIRGLSRQPLLDACRAIERAGADPAAEIALFRLGATDWDVKTTVGHGARLSVREDRLKFEKFKAFGVSRKEAAHVVG